jgi:hypothetical protein
MTSEELTMHEKSSALWRPIATPPEQLVDVLLHQVRACFAQGIGAGGSGHASNVQGKGPAR